MYIFSKITSYLALELPQRTKLTWSCKMQTTYSTKLWLSELWPMSKCKGNLWCLFSSVYLPCGKCTHTITHSLTDWLIHSNTHLNVHIWYLLTKSLTGYSLSNLQRHAYNWWNLTRYKMSINSTRCWYHFPLFYKNLAPKWFPFVYFNYFHKISLFNVNSNHQ